MRGRRRGLLAGSACVAVAIWLNVNGAAAQAPPTIPAPPDPTTAPTTVAPPDEEPAPTPAPPPAPSDTIPPGSPDAPSTPAGPAPTPGGTTTTTAPPDKLRGAGLSPPRSIEGSAPAVFSLDLSEIDALRRAARGKGPRTPEPDFGFDPTLEFQSRPGIATGQGEEALELGAEDEKIARVRKASSIAAGLLALLLTAMAAGALRQARTALPQAGD